MSFMAMYLKYFKYKRDYMRLERISHYVFLFEAFAGSPRPFICNHHQTQKQAPEVFCKKSFLRNFANFTGKHLC